MAAATAPSCACVATATAVRHAGARCRRGVRLWKTNRHRCPRLTRMPPLVAAGAPEEPAMTDIIVRHQRREFLPFSPPLVGEEEIREVIDTLRSPWITTGPKTRRFEEEFSAFVQAAAGGALALNSCTAAMHVALACLEIGPGDEVITTPMTFTATANVIEHVGARPVLVDVEPDTLNIDPQKVAAAITPRTRALLPVHYSGHPAERDVLEAIARTHNLALIEDAAHALPASFRGKPIGAGPNPC